MALRSWSRVEERRNEGSAKNPFQAPLSLVAMIIGLGSATYLVYQASYLLFLAVIFGFNAPPTPVLDYLVFVTKNAIPVICFLSLGIAGFRFWSAQRFWPWGLSIVVIETALAIYDFADPASELLLKMVPD